MAVTAISAGVDTGGAVQLCLLGSPKLERSHRPIKLATRKSLAILAYLTLKKYAVPKTELEALLWPEQDEKHAKRNLRDELTRLRKALGDGFLQTTRQDVHLLTDGLKVDLWQLEQALASCHRDAVTLYQPLLAGFYVQDAAPFENWLVEERVRLQSVYVLTLGQLSKEAEERGKYLLALQYLRAIIKIDPFIESAQIRYMRLTARIGERTAALRHFKALHKLYLGELGLTPPKPMFDLITMIEKGKLKLPKVGTKPQPPNHIPTPLTFILGRDTLIEDIKQRLSCSDQRLLNLTGPGGVGKTRLSLQVAKDMLADFADGIYFVELAPVRDATLVLSCMLKTLGLTEAGNQLDMLKATLKSKQTLLILDNFEHVLAAKLDIVSLLRACPKLKILISSRNVLNVRGEHEVRVYPLALPNHDAQFDTPGLVDNPSLRLFLQRAQAVNANFELDETNTAFVVELCRRLDGLPLAIELAAARMKLMSPETLLERLESRFKVLTGGPADLPVRQRSLKDSITWSFEQLSLREQQLLARLGIFVGGFTLEAAERVCADSSGGILDSVHSLIDQSMVQCSLTESRFSLLQSVKAFALEQLSAKGLATVQKRHALFYVDLAEKAARNMAKEQELWLDKLEAEHDNLRQVLSWALEHNNGVGLRLCAALWNFWTLQGHYKEGCDWYRKLLAINHPNVQRAKARNDYGSLAHY